MGLVGGRRVFLFAFEPVAVAIEDYDFGVVDEAVDHGGNGDGDGVATVWAFLLRIRVIGARIRSSADSDTFLRV